MLFRQVTKDKVKWKRGKLVRERITNRTSKNEFLIILSAHLTSYALPFSPLPFSPLPRVLIFSFQFPLQSYCDNNCYVKFKYIIFN